MDFQLKSVPLLSRIGADRADQVRTDIDAATAGWADAALLRLDSRNQVMVADGRVLLGKAKTLADKPPSDAVFLGRIEDGRHAHDTHRQRRSIEAQDRIGEASEADEIGRDDLTRWRPGGHDTRRHQARERGFESNRIEPVLPQAAGGSLCVRNITIPGVDNLAVSVTEREAIDVDVVGLVDRRAPGAWLPARPPSARARLRGARRLHRRG